MEFLNQVMSRYPDAISMAPGAPHDSILAEADAGHYLEIYRRRLAEQGLDDTAIRRRIYQYGPSRGQINDVIAAGLRRDEGISVPAEAIVVTVGAQEAMLLALRVLHPESSDVVAVISPTYVGITAAAGVLGVSMVAVPEGSDGPDLDALARICQHAGARGQRVRTLYVAPDFANPSGALTSLPGRLRLLELAEQLDLLVIEDSAYAFTASQSDRLPSLKSLDRQGRVLHIGTFAKIGLPGLRVGYVVADQIVADGIRDPHPLATELAAVKNGITLNTSPVCQAVVAGMLLEHGGSLSRLAERKAERYRQNLAVLLHALDRHLRPLRSAGVPVSWTTPAGGFFVRVWLPFEIDDAMAERCAGEFGLLLTPMRHFFLDGGGTHEVRLACSALDHPVIDEGIARLAAFIQAVVARG